MKASGPNCSALPILSSPSPGILGGIVIVWVYLLIRIKVPLWFTLIHFGMQTDKSIFVGDPSVWGARSLPCPARPGAPPWEPDASSL